jgi:hypothetical protein
VSDYLLANLIDAVRELTWVTVKVNSDKNAHVQRPDPVPRPGKQPAAAGKQVRWADLPKLFGAVNGA